MTKSTKNPRPSKPYPDFPLFAHATGRWAKKIRGKFHYFGPWHDPDSALERYLDQRDDLNTGCRPPSRRHALSVRELCDHFLSAKKAKVETGELTQTTCRDYQISCAHLIRFFGRSRAVEDLRGDDFSAFRSHLTKTNGLVGLRNQVRNARIVFNYAYQADLIERPVKYGADFAIPSAREIRNQRTSRMFEADEIRRMLKHADIAMKAMILLGANCGFGNADVERLPLAALNLDDGWVDYPRKKTGTDRRVPLWPETVAAIRHALAARPTPASDDAAAFLFLTRRGESWHKPSTRYLTEQFRKFLQRLDRDAKKVAEAQGGDIPDKLYRRGVGFFCLRHVFETVGGESCDQIAVDAILGHQRGDMASVSRDRISDDRLRKVVETVHGWLFAALKSDKDESATVPFPSSS